MQVVMIHNPRSGRGLGKRLAGRLSAALVQRGHRVKSLIVGGDEGVDVDRLGEADAFVVIGGDGSVRYQIEAARESGTPIYHAGTGNENLFAKHFRMRRSPVGVVRAVEEQRVCKIDVGRVRGLKNDGAKSGGAEGGSDWSGDGGEPVLLMVGAGCEASVIRRFATAREGGGGWSGTRAIGHLAYLKPVVKEAIRPTLEPVRVWVDGELVIENGRGQLLIANCPRYAVRSDPARRAVMDDGLLDVVFMPSGSSVRSLAWMVGARMRVAERLPGWVSVRGKSVRVEWSESNGGDSGPIQVDGEWARSLEGESGAGFEVGVEERVLPVLLPG